jgi:tRNA nucleotidyltransferase (CCA-adding enzyme)
VGFRWLHLDPGDPATLLAAIAALPGAGPLLAAVATVDEPVHLVGGAVRDVLVGRTPRELDVVVEGETAPLIHALGGEVRAHDRFETATVAMEGGGTIDIARSRSETYSEPGALPDVEPAPLAIDLHRRDVTLNAIAVDLRTGAVTQPGTAIDDLDRALLRVLHPMSFIDDPTRLWRLARYEVRLAADWDPISWTLARAAIEHGALETVSVQRLASELRLALREPDAYGALAAAGRLGLWPRFDFDALRLEQADRLAGDAALPSEVMLAALATDDPQLTRMLDRREETTLIEAALLLRDPAGGAGRPGPLADTASGSTVRKRFHGLPVAAIAAAPDAAAAERWLRELAHVRPQIDGTDLIAAGVAAGPALGRGLDAARDAVLDGEIGHLDRDGQLRVALRAAC